MYWPSKCTAYKTYLQLKVLTYTMYWPSKRTACQNVPPTKRTTYITYLPKLRICLQNIYCTLDTPDVHCGWIKWTVSHLWLDTQLSLSLAWLQEVEGGILKVVFAIEHPLFIFSKQVSKYKTWDKSWRIFVKKIYDFSRSIIASESFLKKIISHVMCVQ